jgi:hypothetical protein
MNFYLLRGKLKNYGFSSLESLESYKKENDEIIEEHSLHNLFQLPTLMIREKINDHIVKVESNYTRFFNSVNDVIIYLHTLQEDSWSNVYDEGVCEFEVEDECISKYGSDGNTSPLCLYEKKKYTYDILLTLEFIHLI